MIQPNQQSEKIERFIKIVYKYFPDVLISNVRRVIKYYVQTVKQCFTD